MNGELIAGMAILAAMFACLVAVSVWGQGWRVALIAWGLATLGTAIIAAGAALLVSGLTQ